MTITLKPETERLVRQELDGGHFHNIDEIIVEGVRARREKEPLTHLRGVRLTGGTKTPGEAGEDVRRISRGKRLPPGVTIRDLINEGRA